MIRITAKTEGFRRCGIAHSTEPTEYPDDRFSKAELQQLQADPMLAVEVVDEEPKRPSQKEAIKAVKAAATIKELDALLEGEDRQKVLDAIKKRRDELTAPAEG